MEQTEITAIGSGLQPKVGIVGFGEVNTPREIIEKKCARAIESLVECGFEVTSTAPVSDDPAGIDAERAIRYLKAKPFDVLVACVAGWIPSQTVIRVASEFSNLPMLLWGLAGTTESGRLVTTADQAGTTALRHTFEELGWKFKYVTDYPDTPPHVDRVSDFIRVATALRSLNNSRIGMMGYRDMNLYATLHDGVSLRRQLGIEIEGFEMLEMVRRSECLDKASVKSLVEQIGQEWSFEKAANNEVLEQGAKYYLAIREKVLERNYQGISLIDVDGMKKLLQFPPAMVFMLLADELKICTIPENDAMGAVTQLITRALTGQIAAYLEFYEFFPTGALLGVPDYVPSEIVDGPVRVLPSSFGHLAGGLLNVSRIKPGLVTLCRLARQRGRYVLHIASGNAAPARRWEEVGWAPPAPQLPGIEFVLDGDIEEFAQEVMGQHYILSYGNNVSLFKEFCKLSGIEVIGECSSGRGC